LIRFWNTAQLDQCAGLLTRLGAWNEDIRCEGASPEALAGGGKALALRLAQSTGEAEADGWC